MTLLQATDVTVQYGRKSRGSVRAVDGVSLGIAPGEILGLVGESGCGKSTLARALAGLVPLQRGRITFNGRPVAPLSRGSRDRDQLGLQMVFQDPFTSLNPRRRVGRQLHDGLRQAGNTSNSDQRIRELLARVDLPPDAAGRHAHEFSGGQRQRIAIARALSVGPGLLVADEPTSALDASIQAQVTNVLRRLCDEDGMSVLLISHDLPLVHHVADRTAVMYLGEIVENGPATTVWRRPKHPYTQALIAAMPAPDRIGTLPADLTGEVPDPANPPNGCRFRPRCEHAFHRCGDHPPLLEVSRAEQVACWLHDHLQGAATTEDATRGR